MLFTGDIHQEAERTLLTTAPNLKSTILKVPHHGSSTSSSLAFLKQVQPEIAIMNLGFKNIFHLPSRKVLKRYQDQGCNIFRTDQDGAITIETDGSDIHIKTFLRRENRTPTTQNTPYSAVNYKLTHYLGSKHITGY